jgi:hypothetical protein
MFLMKPQEQITARGRMFMAPHNAAESLTETAAPRADIQKEPKCSQAPASIHLIILDIYFRAMREHFSLSRPPISLKYL